MMTRTKRPLAAAATMLAASALAAAGFVPPRADAEATRAQQAARYSYTGTTLISNIRVIDGLGSAPVENQGILVADGQIAEIGPAGSLTAPEGALEIDGAGMTAMPGLMDLHIHTQGGWANGLIPGEAYEVTYDDESVQQRRDIVKSCV